MKPRFQLPPRYYQAEIDKSSIDILDAACDANARTERGHAGMAQSAIPALRLLGWQDMKKKRFEERTPFSSLAANNITQNEQDSGKAQSCNLFVNHAGNTIGGTIIFAFDSRMTVARMKTVLLRCEESQRLYLLILLIIFQWPRNRC